MRPHWHYSKSRDPSNRGTGIRWQELPASQASKSASTHQCKSATNRVSAPNLVPVRSCKSRYQTSLSVGCGRAVKLWAPQRRKPSKNMLQATCPTRFVERQLTCRTQPAWSCSASFVAPPSSVFVGLCTAPLQMSELSWRTDALSCAPVRHATESLSAQTKPRGASDTQTKAESLRRAASNTKAHNAQPAGGKCQNVASSPSLRSACWSNSRCKRSQES